MSYRGHREQNYCQPRHGTNGTRSRRAHQTGLARNPYFALQHEPSATQATGPAPVSAPRTIPALVSSALQMWIRCPERKDIQPIKLNSLEEAAKLAQLAKKTLVDLELKLNQNTIGRFRILKKEDAERIEKDGSGISLSDLPSEVLALRAKLETLGLGIIPLKVISL